MHQPFIQITVYFIIKYSFKYQKLIFAPSLEFKIAHLTLLEKTRSKSSSRTYVERMRVHF